VQEHGRANKLFTGMKAVLDQDQTLLAFGTGTGKTPNTAISDALAAFFQQQWSLCDMAYKYVVMSASNDISVHDSYALAELPQQTHPPTCARCLFCPVCFSAPAAVLDPNNTQPDPMHSHIQNTHRTYYMRRTYPNRNAEA
jgi:formate dehydrogenase maturation protein FdhE